MALKQVVVPEVPINSGPPDPPVNDGLGPDAEIHSERFIDRLTHPPRDGKRSLVTNVNAVTGKNPYGEE